MNGIPYRHRCMIEFMASERGGKPTAGDARNESLRKIVRAICMSDHKGVQKDTADALGVVKGTLGDFLNGRSGAGQQLQDGLVAYLQRPIEEIVAARGDIASLRTTRTSARGVQVRFGDLPLWTVLLEGARSLDPSVPDWCWVQVADAVVWIRYPVTSAMVLDLARFFLRHAPPDIMTNAISSHVQKR